MKPATTVTAILLFLIAIAQLLRFIFQVEVVAGGFRIPLWPSAIACIVAAILAIMLWRERRS